MSRPVLLAILASLALFAPVAALASPPQQFPPDKNATGTANVILPASITKLNDMDFSCVTVTTAGTAILESDTGAVTTTEGVLLPAACHMPPSLRRCRRAKRSCAFRFPAGR